MISNVRILEQNAHAITIEANFIVHRFRRQENVRQYVGQYRYVLRIERGGFRIAVREAIIDAMELGSLGSVSFIL
jgi:3-phenylpropionate/cinnamic acid dioxygenase small subunit